MLSFAQFSVQFVPVDGGGPSDLAPTDGHGLVFVLAVCAALSLIEIPVVNFFFVT